MDIGDEVLVSGDPKGKRMRPALATKHEGPFRLTGMTEKGLATIATEKSVKTINVSRLRPYNRPASKFHFPFFYQTQFFNALIFQINPNRASYKCPQ